MSCAIRTPPLVGVYHLVLTRTNGEDTDGAHYARHGSDDQLGSERNLVGGEERQQRE